MAISNEEVNRTNNLQPTTMERVNEMVQKFVSTDRKSFVIRVSVGSVILSLCALQLFVNYIWTQGHSLTHYINAIYVAVAISTYGLYTGLSNENVKDIFPWIIYKLIEVIITFVCFIRTMTGYRFHFYDFMVALVVLALDVIILFILYKNQVSSEVSAFRSENKKPNSPTV